MPVGLFQFWMKLNILHRTSVDVAESLAKKAMAKKITKIYFDRGRYKYHGRIKIFAETLRKNGLIF